MFHIAICDDDLPTTEQVEKLILDTQGSFPEQIVVSTFYSGEGFSNAIQDGCPFEIVFMDIEMQAMDGIKAGHVLRMNDENDMVQLIYISSHEKYHQQLFDVQPSGFIIKPIDSDLFRKKLISAIKKSLHRKQQGKMNFLPIHQQGKEALVPFRDIMYLESSIRKISLHTRSEEIQYYSTLNDEEKKLPPLDFVRIHQSYIVNFYFIKNIFNRKVILVTGTELPISEKNSALVKKNYLKFRGSLVE